MSIVCKKCGRECFETDKRCPACGADLSQAISKAADKKDKIRTEAKAEKLKAAREEQNFSMYLMISAFTDGNVFYEKKSVYSDILVAVLPVITYLFIFLHIGLDKLFLSYIGLPKLFFFIFLSILYGLGSVLLKAGTAIGAGLIDSNKMSIGFIDSVRATGFSYFIPAVVGFLGVLFRLIASWSSLSFGILALLLTVYPFYSMLDGRIKNKLIVIVASTVVGIVQCLAVSPLLFTKFL